MTAAASAGATEGAPEGAAAPSPGGTVTVVGVGTVEVEPDALELRIRVVAVAPTVGAAVDQGETLTHRVRDAVSAHAEVDTVASDGFHTGERWAPDGAADGFEAAHLLVVRCRSSSAVADLVEVTTAAGGDGVRIDAVTPVVRNPGAALDTAREWAFSDARRRAIHLAGLAGRQLGPVVTVREGGRPGEPGLVRSAAESAYQPGASSVSAALEVTWSLR